jgi:hypothetical protein
MAPKLRFLSVGIAFSLSLLALPILAPIAHGAIVVATGTNPTLCNQTVSSAESVTAERSGQECIVTFTNSAEVIWTVPLGVTNISAIVVAGGGGGGDSAGGSTGGGGGAGGFFQNSSIYVTGTVPISVGAGGSGSISTTQGGTGGTSYLGSLKVGGGGGGNGYTYQGGTRALTGIGGSDFVSSGSGGGARPTANGTGAENQGGTAGAIAPSGVSYLGFTYTGIQGEVGAGPSDGASGGFGGQTSPESARTSTISGVSVAYSKRAGYRAWEDNLNTAGTKTPGSGGSTNYAYGSNTYPTGGAGAAGMVIVRYTWIAGFYNLAHNTSLTKGATESITANVNIPGKVRFYIGGKRIPGCLAIATTGTAPNLTATCSWKPAVKGSQVVYAVLTPTEVAVAAKTSSNSRLFVSNRQNTR